VHNIHIRILLEETLDQDIEILLGNQYNAHNFQANTDQGHIE
jgi:hypothetical protein